MLPFRSEEHLGKWLKDWNLLRGAILSLDQCWRLAQAWYGEDRREPNWRRKTVAEAQTLFAELGLTGSFWDLE